MSIVEIKKAEVGKITRPNPSPIFPRNRLFRRLDKAVARPVTIVTGPPGSGKTSLVTSYLGDRDIDCIWYQADERDADPASFFYYMGLAAVKAGSRYNKPLPLFNQESGRALVNFTRSYFESLCSRLKRPCVVVFDNYQEIPCDSPVHEIIRAGLSAIPRDVSSIIVSRAEPPQAFALMHVIEWEDLKLTRVESKGIARLQEIGRPKSGIYDWLHEKSDGWAAGLVLLARAVKSREIDPAPLSGVVPDNVSDYFTNELFMKLEKPLQEFLLKTAFAPRITPEMAEDLTGNKAAGEILSGLNRRSCFTEKRSHPKVIYQYHPLFRRFLINLAAQRFGPGKISSIKLKAAELLEGWGEIQEAAELFIQAGAWKQLTALIYSHARTLLRQGGSRLLERWIAAVPDETLERDPWLNFWLGSSRLGGDPMESRPLLERAFDLFVSSENDEGAFLAWSGVVQSYLYALDDFKSLDRWISWLDERGGKDIVFPSPEIAVIVAAGMTGALSRRNPSHAEMQDWSGRALSLSKNCPDIDGCILACANCAVYYIWKGMHDECRLFIDEVKRMLEPQQVSPLTSLVLKHTEALFYNTSVQNQQQALWTVSEGIEEARRTGVHALDPFFYNQGVIVSLNEGNPGRAAEFLSKLEETLRKGRRTQIAHYHYLSAHYHLMTGETHRAVVSARESLALAQEMGVPFSEIIARLALSHALQADREQDEAELELEAAWPVIRATDSFHFEYLYWLTDAYFKYVRKDETGGGESLKKAMTLGRRSGFATQFNLWRPDVMGFLCGKALEAGIEVEYVRNLIPKLNLSPGDESIEMESWPWPVKIYLLGRFQMFIDGEPVQFSGKIQKKPLMLLKALIILGRGEVRTEQIEDALWPEAEGDEARNSFDTTLHRLRKWIKHPDAFHFGSGVAEMDRKICWTDVWAFESLIEKAGLEEQQDKAERALELMEKAVSLYKGTLLPGEENEQWTVSPRERMRRKFLRCVRWLGLNREAAREWEEAVAWYDRGLEVDDIYEEFYQRMMLCYQHLGRTAEALATYERCRRILSRILGLRPSSKIEEIHNSLLF